MKSMIPYCVNKQKLSFCKNDPSMNTGSKKKTISDKMRYSQIVNGTYKPVNPANNQVLRPF
jgi:hypothetical protein